MIGHFVDSGGKVKHGNIAADEPLDAAVNELYRRDAEYRALRKAALDALALLDAIHEIGRFRLGLDAEDPRHAELRRVLEEDAT